MKKFFNFNLIVFLLFTCICRNASAQSMQAEAKLQQYTIKIGDQTKLFLSVHQPAKEKVNFPKLTDTIMAKVLVVSAGKRDTTFDTADHSRATVTQSYVITSFDEGKYTIRPFTFGTSEGAITTGDLTLQVQTVKVDTTKAIYDIKQPLAVSYTLWDWIKDHWIWVLSGLLLIALIIGLIWYLKNRPKDIPIIRVIKPVIPIHVIALNKLQELRGKKLWQQGEIKQYHIELSDVLREYLEKRYTIKTYEKTTDEIFEELKYVEITGENKNMLRQILMLADLVKFAKEQPVPAENELSMDNAIIFVTKTQQADIQAPATEEGGANEPV
jgi:hypothetical protein